MTRSFTYFLKDRDQPLYDEYVMERYKEGLTGKGTVTPEPKFTFPQPKFRKKDICDELTKISELNTTHRAKKYLINRGDKVVIWPSNIQEKDVNDMILAKHNICTILESSTYS